MNHYLNDFGGVGKLRDPRILIAALIAVLCAAHQPW
jgi:hypothetical protein